MEGNDFEILLIDVTFYTRYVKKLTFNSNKKGEKNTTMAGGARVK